MDDKPATVTIAKPSDMIASAEHMFGTKHKPVIYSWMKQEVHFKDCIKCEVDGSSGIHGVDVNCESSGNGTLHFDKNKNNASHHKGGKSFKCEMCKKHFARYDYLKIHMLIHTGESPHTCSICEKQFTISFALHLHFEHTHERSHTNVTYVTNNSLNLLV